MLNLDLTYTRIQMAEARCKEIIKEMEIANDCSFTVKGLKQEYEWSVTFIINQCEAILESDQYDDNHEDLLYRIALLEYQEMYKNIKSTI